MPNTITARGRPAPRSETPNPLPAVIVETGLTWELHTQLAARARADGTSIACVLRHAAEHYMAWSHDQGEMRRPGDVLDDDVHLPRPEDLL